MAPDGSLSLLHAKNLVLNQAPAYTNRSSYRIDTRHHFLNRSWSRNPLTCPPKPRAPWLRPLDDWRWLDGGFPASVEMASLPPRPRTITPASLALVGVWMPHKQGASRSRRPIRSRPGAKP